MSRRCPPDWTLTGVGLQWPDGQQSMLAQSAWRPTETGWTCSLALRHTSLPRHTRVVPLDLHVTNEVLSEQTDSPELWMRARDLITNRVRNRADHDALATHL